MNASAFRDLWARVMFWKFSKLENFQNITSDHKSRNARASSYDFLFIIYSTKSLLRSSLHALRTTSKALQWFPKYSHVLFEPIKNIMLWQGKSSVKFPKVSQVFSVFSSFLIWCSNLALPLCFHGNFHIALYNLHLHSITYLCIRHWPIRNSEICSVYNKPFYSCLLSDPAYEWQRGCRFSGPRCFYHVNCVVVVLTSLYLHKKSKELCIKTKSPAASLPFIGRVTEPQL